MSITKLPAIDTLPTAAPETQAAVLDLLFEPSSQLHTLVLPIIRQDHFTTYDNLITAVNTQLTALAQPSSSTADNATLDAILGSHPRLGAKKVESAQSQAEQAQLQGSADEAEQLRALNEAYERAFPGLRYVVFVNGRGRPEIMEDMRVRIARADPVAERAAAIRVSFE